MLPRPILAVLLALVAATCVAAVPAHARLDLPPLTNVTPTVAGTPKDGQALRAHPGRWTPRRTETRYQWLRDGEPVRGADARTYRLTAPRWGTGSRTPWLSRSRAGGAGDDAAIEGARRLSFQPVAAAGRAVRDVQERS